MHKCIAEPAPIKCEFVLNNVEIGRRQAETLQLVIEKHKVRLVEQTGAFGVCDSTRLEEDFSEAGGRLHRPCIRRMQG